MRRDVTMCPFTFSLSPAPSHRPRWSMEWWLREGRGVGGGAMAERLRRAPPSPPPACLALAAVGAVGHRAFVSWRAARACVRAQGSATCPRCRPGHYPLFIIPYLSLSLSLSVSPCLSLSVSVSLSYVPKMSNKKSHEEEEAAHSHSQAPNPPPTHTHKPRSAPLITCVPLLLSSL